MVGQASLSTPVAAPRTGLVWAQTPEATSAKITGGVPGQQEWRRFLDQIRPSSKPVLVWLRGRIWLGSAAREELARAIGTSSVALVVDDDIGRGLATALRWMGSNVEAFDANQIDQIGAALGIDQEAVYGLLQRLTR